MKRTTIFLPEQTVKQLQRAAQRRHVSTATLIREAVATYLSTPRSAGAIPSIAGQFASGSGETSEHVDELLWEDPHA